MRETIEVKRVTAFFVALCLAAGMGCDTETGSGQNGADDDGSGRGRSTTDLGDGGDSAVGDVGLDGVADCDGPDCEPGPTCAGEMCDADTVLCEADALLGCEDGLLLYCNPDGTGHRRELCPPGEVCADEECIPVLPNVLLLVDTSSSMNWTPGGTSHNDCRSSCWPWSYPSCDNDPSGPQTRLGRIKKVLTQLLESDTAADTRIALQRFPQYIWTGLPPDCEGGFWTGATTIQGDEGFHALSRVWLQQNLEQIILVPFPASGETDREEIASWFDFEESFLRTDTSCTVDEECDGRPCLEGYCRDYGNPELWGMGLTPFGKSLFYAGEYMRHFVVVEGKECDTTADCASPNYTCEEGACHDRFGHCRPNVVIAFTDGEETEHFYTDRFFNPRVQAKRLHYGLGCERDSHCAADATCQDFVCRPPDGVVDEDQLVCDANDVPCTQNEDCSGHRCRPARLDFVDAGGEDHISDAAGNPISLTIHVVDASNVPGANNLVAAYGGGRHFSVDLENPEEIFAIFEELFGDTKEAICVEE